MKMRWLIGLLSLPLCSSASAATVATPVCTPPTGTKFANGQIITCSSATSGATQCYTLDGSSPAAFTPGTCSHGTTLANGGTINIAATETVNILGTLSGDTNSTIAGFAYTVGGGSTTNIDDIVPTSSASPTIGWATPPFVDTGCGNPTGPTSFPHTVGNVSPSVDGFSSLFTLVSAPEGCVGWFYNAGPDDTNNTNITNDFEYQSGSTNSSGNANEFDVYLYEKSASNPACLPNNTDFYFGTQCVTSTGHLQIWDEGGTGWHDTSPTINCASGFASGTGFHHITMHDHWVCGDTSGTGGFPKQWYDSIVIDGTSHAINTAYSSNSLPISYTENSGVNFELDVGAAGTTLTANLDQASITFAGNTIYVAQTAGVFGSGTACNGQTTITLATWNGLTLAPGTLTWVCGTITVAAAGGVGFNFGGNSGSSGNPLILRFDTNAVVVCATYCEGGGGGTNGGAIAFGTGNSFITVDGNGLTGTVANGLNGSSGAACYLGTCTVQHSSTLVTGWDCTNCTIQNLNIVDAYVNTTGDSTIGDSSTVNAFTVGGSSWTISGNVMHDFGWNEEFGDVNDSGFQMYNNQIYNYAHGIAVAPKSGMAFSNFSIHDNWFHDAANWGAPGCFAHIDALHVFGSTGSSVNNFYFYNNRMDGNWGTCPTGAIFVEGGGSSSAAHMGSSFWWNNVVNATNGPTNLTQGWIGVFSGNSGVQQFFNNTVICPSTTDNGVAYALSGETGHTNMSALTFGDNIAICGNPVGLGVSGFGVTLSTSSVGGVTGADYNFYGAFGANAFIWQGTVEESFTAWKTACSCDPHSVQNNTSLLNSNGSPQLGSPVIEEGQNLISVATGTLASLADDTSAGDTRTPVVRPSSGTCSTQGTPTCWDIGAFQFAGGGGIVAPSVTTTTAAGITSTAAFAGGTVTSNGGASVTSEGTCYALTPNPTAPCTSDGTATPFVSNLTGLAPNTVYNYRAFAVNSAGTGYGSNLTFTTLTPPTGSPLIIKGNVIVKGQVKIQ